MKPLKEETIGNALSDLSLSNVVLNMSPQARETKAKINKLDYIKLKGFCTTKETIKKTKRPSSEWKKIFANDTFNKGLRSKIQQKNSYNSSSRKQTTRLKMSREDTQMANGYMKICSTSEKYNSKPQ